MAPEMFNSEGHDRLADWWSLGILIFEMLSGCPPFSNEGIGHNVFEQILRGNIEWPDKIDPIAKDLIEKLLNKDCKKRLGAKGASEVKKHPWFNGLVICKTINEMLNVRSGLGSVIREKAQRSSGP